MFWILGVLVITLITSWILSYYLVNVTLEIVAFLSGVTLFAVLVVWGITFIEASRDYAYLEEYMKNHDAGDTISSAHFLELYTKYKAENQWWIGRQFNAKPSKALEELFEKDYSLQLAFE